MARIDDTVLQRLVVAAALPAGFTVEMLGDPHDEAAQTWARIVALDVTCEERQSGQDQSDNAVVRLVLAVGTVISAADGPGKITTYAMRLAAVLSEAGFTDVPTTHQLDFGQAKRGYTDQEDPSGVRSCVCLMTLEGTASRESGTSVVNAA